MQQNILDAIADQYSSLTRSGRKLANYIFSNKSMTQYMSITSLAESSGVSEATITRFCRRLGLSGYNDFKLALAKADPAVLNQSQEAFSADDTITPEDSFDLVCQKLYQMDMIALNRTLAMADESQVSRAVTYMSRSNRVFCFGQGGSNVMAMEAWIRFSTASPKFIHIEDSHMQAMAAALTTDQDTILFFSYSGATKDMVDVLEPAKENGAKIILVTHFANSPAAALADAILLCGVNESPLQSGSIAARLGQLFIIEYLFYAYCMKNPDYTSQAKASTSQATARKLI